MLEKWFIGIRAIVDDIDVHKRIKIFGEERKLSLMCILFTCS